MSLRNFGCEGGLSPPRRCTTQTPQVLDCGYGLVAMTFASHAKGREFDPHYPYANKASHNARPPKSRRGGLRGGLARGELGEGGALGARWGSRRHTPFWHSTNFCPELAIASSNHCALFRPQDLYTQKYADRVALEATSEARATRTPNLLIWSQTRCHCAMAPY